MVDFKFDEKILVLRGIIVITNKNGRGAFKLDGKEVIKELF